MSGATLLIDRAVRAGFLELICRVTARPEPGTDPERIARLMRVSEQVCVNLDTLRRGTPISVEIDLSAGGTRRKEDQ